MYQVANPSALLRSRRAARSIGRPAVSRTVVLLGVTSLLTDISSEMVVTVLPLYLVYIGGFTPLAFGIIDGLYQGATALLGLASGFIGDRFRRHKDVATAGYGISAVCKLLLAVVGTGLSAVGAVILLDRAGKGIRSAPRDAMISLSTPEKDLGTAFGVHRSMDTVGAMLGPLAAFALLAAAPLAFESLFLVSFCVAVLGLGVLVLLVPRRPAAPGAVEPPRPPGIRDAAQLLRLPRFRSVLLAGAVLSLATASDAFVFLALQEQLDLGTSLFPLLFVGSAGVFMLLAIPVGRLSDRLGRGRVMIAGYVLLLAVYAVLLSPAQGWLLATGTLGFLGAYYACTDGVLMALGSASAAEEVRGSGLALLRTVTSIARLLASVAFGLLWTLWGISAAVAAFAVALAAATVLAIRLLRSAGELARA